MERYLEVMVEAAHSAGRALLGFYGRLKAYETKISTSDLVTEADRNAEMVIKGILREAFPNVAIYAEEETREKGKLTFYVDPLDGTLNFFHGVPFFCVSIALWEGDEGIAGVVHDPIRNETFWALKGGGAFLNGRRIAPSDIECLEKALFVTGWPYDIRESDEDNLRFFNRMAKAVQEIRALGTAALETCYVACGRLDGYWEIKLAPWDLAAGYVIASEAGAKVSGVYGDFNLHRGDILVTSPGIFEGARKTLLGTG